MLEFKVFFPTAGSHLFISAFFFDLPAQHPASAMGWHISSGTGVGVAVLTPAHVHGHTPPLARILHPRG